MLAEIQLKSATASYRNTEQERALDAVHSHLKIFKSLQKFELQKSNTTRTKKRVAAAKELGATEVHIVGGFHPDLQLDYYEQMMSTIKRKL